MNEVFLYAFGLYASVLGAISWTFYQKSTDAKDFILGNRSVNYIATAIATHSSDMSIWLFMGFPGVVYTRGLIAAWIPIGLLIGMFCVWTFVAPQLRLLTAAQDSLTLSGYLETRLNDKSGSLRLVSALISLIFFTFYISSGLVGMGLMFESVFQMDYHLGVFIGLVTTLLYTLVGGFVGVAWCDLFQGLFLVTMIVLVPVFALQHIPSISYIFEVAQLKQISMSLVGDTQETSLFAGILLALSWGLGYFGQPHILVNFMGIDNVAALKKGRTVGMTWQLLTLASSVCIGLIGIGFFAKGIPSSELVFVDMVQQIFSPFFAGIVLCAIVAAGLTTIDTQILVSGSIFSHDIYKQYLNPKASAAEELRVSKVGLLIIPVISYAIAFSKSASVYGLVEYAWMGLGATFGPVILTTLHSNKITKHGALIGMLVGGTIAASWRFTGSPIPAMIPAFLANFCILLFTAKR